MIYLASGLLFYSVFTLLLSGDPLDFARACMRTLVVVILISCARFTEQAVLEGVVSLLIVLQLSLFAFVRMEVQVDHDRS